MSIAGKKISMELFSKKKTHVFFLDHMIELLLLLLIVVLGLFSPAFLTVNNILNILRNVAMKGVIAYGMCLVILAGEIDLSVGSQVALCAVITAYISKVLSDMGIMPIEYGAALGLLVAILVAVGIGAFHAWARQKFNMPTFIITLANLNVMYGLAAIICGGFPIVNSFPGWYVFTGVGKVFGIPFPALVFIAVFMLFWFITEKTDLGRKIYAVGGNAEAARLNGINVFRTRAFVMCAVQVMCVLGGMMNSAQVRSATFGFGRSWETQIISSVVIGGTSMLGGIGTIWGTLVGVMFTGVISNGMTLLNINEYMQYVINGGLMFFAVMFNTYMTRKRA
ncbi:MAG: ABC transporter permease [Christensenellaceae bacterium]|nr:ABC transporter permease [Christensenellaceae bacterium]MEA5068842.1 ABC transporter permease [Christensenellaceae bacterium]